MIEPVGRSEQQIFHDANCLRGFKGLLFHILAQDALEGFSDLYDSEEIGFRKPMAVGAPGEFFRGAEL